MQRFKPNVDKLYLWIFLPTFILIISATVIISIFDPITIPLVIFIDLFIVYFFASPLFGYVELRESELFIKYGFFLKRSIPYSRIRSLEKKRSFISTSMMSLKCAICHIDIKYNVFDVTTVGVRDNDALINAVTERMGR